MGGMDTDRISLLYLGIETVLITHRDLESLQITLTTIGFGDYSPGSSFHGDMTFLQVIKMTFTTLYCLLGLAIISMGISLSSEEVKNKAEQISYAVGFKEDEAAYKRRWTLTRHTGVRETPRDKTGNRQDFMDFGKRGRGTVHLENIYQE